MKKILYTLVAFIVLPIYIFTYSPQVKADTIQATNPVRFRLSLTNSTSFIEVPKAHSSNFKGQNTHVVVIDSGVDTTNAFLVGRVVLEACFASICPNGTNKMIGQGAAKPVHWHGTHVAGIIAGSNSTMTGVAPEAKIIAVNVFDPNVSTFDANIVNALEWVDSISDQYNISAINMSLGTSMTFKSSCNSFIPNLTSVISKLKSKNIATVVSAGNSYSYGMSSPACITDTVSVAATYSNKNFVTDFSNIHEDTDLSAPGYNIYSSVLGNSFRHASGTSMAAPHVAGAFAVYRSKFGVQSVDTIIDDFQDSSVPALDDYTKIYSKRIDFNGLFGNGTPTTSTTVVSTTTTTTTIPRSTTTTIPRSTTTTTLPPSDGGIEFGLGVPEILFISKYIRGNEYIYLDFKYMSDLSKVSHYLLNCTYISSPDFTRTLPNRKAKVNYYLVTINSLDIDSCRMAAVSISGTIGQYTQYSKVK